MLLYDLGIYLNLSPGTGLPVPVESKFYPVLILDREKKNLKEKVK
jgi:hypothetical protein